MHILFDLYVCCWRSRSCTLYAFYTFRGHLIPVIRGKLLCLLPKHKRAHRVWSQAEIVRRPPFVEAADALGTERLGEAIEDAIVELALAVDHFLAVQARRDHVERVHRRRHHKTAHNTRYSITRMRGTVMQSKQVYPREIDELKSRTYIRVEPGSRLQCLPPSPTSSPACTSPVAYQIRSIVASRFVSQTSAALGRDAMPFR